MPQEVAPANKNLAESYRAMGGKLRLIPDANTDEEKIQAMLGYNATVETFTKHYIALVTLFSLSGAIFRNDEPGSVFMFSGSL